MFVGHIEFVEGFLLAKSPGCLKHTCLTVFENPNDCGRSEGPLVQELYYKEKAHGPPHLKYCGTGDYLCRGYNETVITDGWFYDLADLDQSHPFVRKFLKDWVKYMVSQIKLGSVHSTILM